MNQLRRVVITGAAGACGAVLVDRLMRRPDVENVLAIDVDEGGLFAQSQVYANSKKYTPNLLDIRHGSLLTRAFIGADAVIHCAAYKNVPMCETSPSMCVEVNIGGTESAISAAIEAKVGVFILTSSDKAVNPTNVMGASKLVGERLVVAANITSQLEGGRTKFAATRFGNVVGTTGSVLPVFVSQISRGEPITLTDSSMTRFMMSRTKAADLVIEATERANGGEIFITKMPVVNMGRFSEAVLELVGGEPGFPAPEGIHAPKIIGLRPGEKLFEELMSSEEVSRSRELDDFLVVLPRNFEVYSGLPSAANYDSVRVCDRVYNSEVEESLDLGNTVNFISSVLNEDGVVLGDLVT